MRLVIAAVLLCLLAASASAQYMTCGAGLGDCILGVSSTTNAHGSSCAGYPTTIGCNMTAEAAGCSLSCSFKPSCGVGELQFLNLSAPTNAHANILLPSVQVICCGFTGTNCGRLSAANVVDVGSGSCPTTYGPASEILRLSSRNNAHISVAGTTGYRYALCVDVITDCNDGVDNDNDGFVDQMGSADRNPDPGCRTPFDPSEKCLEAGCPECDDGIDNDGDGRIDYVRGSGDPGCISPIDESELDDVAAQCEEDCTWTTDNICHAECVGQNGCLSVLNACDGLSSGSIAQGNSGPVVCCAGNPLPALDGNSMRYNSDRDRVRATRIDQTPGSGVIITIVSFR